MDSRCPWCYTGVQCPRLDHGRDIERNVMNAIVGVFAIFFRSLSFLRAENA